MAKKRPKSKAAKVKEIPPAQQNESTADDSISSVLNTKMSTPPVLMKVCRLCEAKDGPFLNIFDADKITAKKIDEIMPFRIEENDDLPHKICFRCSAKLEELYEFLQKCVKTQENLRTAMGKTGPLVMKSKTRALWEEKLEKKNLSNEDICNILIKKAMEGIKDMAPNVLPPPEEENLPKPLTSKRAKPLKKSTSVSSDDEFSEPNLKQVKLSIEKCDEKPPPRPTRSSRTRENKESEKRDPPPEVKQIPSKKLLLVPKNSELVEPEKKKDEIPKNINSFSMDFEENIIAEPKEKTPEKTQPKEVKKKLVPVAKPFNIMDHVCTIKVNGVGILFQCKLCNRNFLKKDVVESHGCAKNNVPKDIAQNNVPLPEPPKPPSTVKYITIDKDFKKNLANELNKKPVEKPVEQIVPEKTILPEPQPVQLVSVKSEPVPPPVKPRPKAGPASKMKQFEQKPPSEPQRIEPKPINSQETKPNRTNPVTPTVNFPIIPSIHSRYKLVPGPNNTFTLVEEASQLDKPTEAEPNKSLLKQNLSVNVKRKAIHMPREDDSSPEIVNLEEKEPVRPKGPYPVGLFQAMPHTSNMYPQLNQVNFTQPEFNTAQFVQPQFTHSQFAPTPQYVHTQYSVAPFIPQTISVQPIVPNPPTFTTPAMKKQSYTIVQTGNPSKLLISTKPQPVSQAPIEEPSRKKLKKKPEVQEQTPDLAKGSNRYFAFVNVDSEQQPSYVLPTDNIIQESQISTSTPVTKVVDDKEYTCNMCNEKFSREKKLLSHIQSHYNMMDEEDEKRAAPKKKGKKS